MRKVIEGKVYDTGTAIHVCDLPCHHFPGDFSYHETGLYRTKKGVYFLAGEGGPMSMWSESTGNNSWSGGSGLMPISADNARAHAEAAGLDPEEMISAGFEIEEA